MLSLSAAPRQAFAVWRGWPFGVHVLALAALALATLVRYAPDVLTPHLHDDEAIYFEAFRLVAEGRSPYEILFYYPPVVAEVGAWAVSHFGESSVLAMVRVGNVSGLAAAVWLGLAWLPGALRQRLAIGVAYLCLAPAVRVGILWGNLSLLVVGLTLVALVGWVRWPKRAGVLLGLASSIKPIAPVALVALGLVRPAALRAKAWWTVGLALVVGAGLALGTLPALLDMLGQGMRGADQTRNASLHRLLYCFDLAPHPLWLVAVAVSMTVLVMRRAVLHPHLVLAVATVAAIVATPVVWSHTLLLLLPLQTMALTTAWAHRPPVGTVDGWTRWRLWLLVVVGVAGIQFSQGVGGIDDRADWLLGLVTLPPALAPLGLLFYLLWTSSFDPRSAMGPLVSSRAEYRP